MKIGQIFKNNQGLEYRIIRIITSCENKHKGALYEIQFIKTNSIRIVYKSSILKGEIQWLTTCFFLDGTSSLPSVPPSRSPPRRSS